MLCWFTDSCEQLVHWFMRTALWKHTCAEQNTPRTFTHHFKEPVDHIVWHIFSFQDSHKTDRFRGVSITHRWRHPLDDEVWRHAVLCSNCGLSRCLCVPNCFCCTPSTLNDDQQQQQKKHKKNCFLQVTSGSWPSRDRMDRSVPSETVTALAARGESCAVICSSVRQRYAMFASVRQRYAMFASVRQRYEMFATVLDKGMQCLPQC